VADRRKIDGQQRNKAERPSWGRNPAAWALLEQSGEAAPVDLGRFGGRAGEIIARAAQSARPSRRRY
jgi:hypothetical protein